METLVGTTEAMPFQSLIPKLFPKAVSESSQAKDSANVR
jgi:hypothetical protein